MELELIKAWKNRHGKEFKNGAVIDFGRDKALKMIEEGVAVLVDVKKTDNEKQDDESEILPDSDTEKELDIY
jgi:hypothetical protein